MSRIHARFRSYVLPVMLKLLLLVGMLGAFLSQQPPAQAQTALPAAASANHVPVLLLHGLEGGGQANCYTRSNFNPPDLYSRWNAFLQLNNAVPSTNAWNHSLIHALAYYHGDALKPGYPDGCDDYIPNDSHCDGYYGNSMDANAGTNNEDIRHIACRFYWYVYDIYTSQGIPVNILAHSMGGIIAKWALSEAAEHSVYFPYPLLVYNVVALSTPFQGVPDNILGILNQISANLSCGGCFEGQQLEVGSNSPNSIIPLLNSFAYTEGVWTVIGSYGGAPVPLLSQIGGAIPGPVGALLAQFLSSSCDIANASPQAGQSYTNTTVSPGPSLASAYVVYSDACIFHEEPQPGQGLAEFGITANVGSTSYQDDASQDDGYAGYQGTVGNGGIFNANNFAFNTSLFHPLGAAFVALSVTRGPDSYPPAQFAVYDVIGGGAFYTVWAATGGPTGPLGVATDGWYTVAGGQEQDFQGGSIYWSPATNTYEVQGDIHAEYASVMGGPTGALNFPTSNEQNVFNSSGAAIGRENTFLGTGCTANDQGSAIIWSSSTGAHMVIGCVYQKYLALGGTKSFLGLPTSDQQAVNGGHVSYFQGTSCGTGGGGGGIFDGPDSGVFSVHGCIYQEYMAGWGGPGGGLNFPTSDEQNAYNSSGAVIGRENTFLGTGCTANNQGSIILSSSSTGTYAVIGCIYQKYVALGGTRSFLGLPTTEQVALNNGHASYFQGTSCGTGGGGGGIFDGPTSGVHEVHGCIYQEYLVAQGGPAGVLGFPTTDQQSIAGGYVSYFYGNLCGSRGPNNSGSAIYNNGGSSTHQVGGCIYNHYWNLGGPSSFLGFPVSDVTAIPNGYVSYFANQVCVSAGPDGSGSAIYSSASGTYEVQGCIYNKYWHDLGGPAGCLGFPITDEYNADSAGDRESDFQHGFIFWQRSNGAISWACA